MGSNQPYDSTKFSSIDFSTEELAAEMRRQQEEFKAGKSQIPPSKNLSELLASFQAETAGACEILVPSRFSILTADRLAPTPEKSKAAPSKGIAN